MELFHATSYKRGKQILSEKVIRVNSPKVYDENHMFPTTQGYVYLTDDLANAVYYGNKTASGDSDEDLIVFCVNVEDSKLEPDHDEIKYTLEFFGKTDGFKDINNPTLEESLRYALSCRIKSDISFKDYNVKYSIITSTFPINSNYKFDEALQTQEFVSLINHHNDFANEYKEKFISRIKWIEC